MTYVEKKNPYEGIQIGDRVEVRLVGCNTSPVNGTVIPNDPKIKGDALTIDTGERTVKYVSKGGKPSEPIEVPIQAIVFGDPENVRVTKLPRQEQ